MPRHPVLLARQGCLNASEGQPPTSSEAQAQTLFSMLIGLANCNSAKDLALSTAGSRYNDVEEGMTRLPCTCVSSCIPDRSSTESIMECHEWTEKGM